MLRDGPEHPGQSLCHGSRHPRGSGALGLSVLEHNTFPLAQVNEALDSIPKRHGGFTNFLCVP
jgi:hypothetical protein